MNRDNCFLAGGLLILIWRLAAAAGLAFMPRDRHRVYYSGRVQGVGFRNACQSLARQFEVAGYVRNLADGRVELVAEGEENEVAAFLDLVHSVMHQYISDVTKGVEPAGETCMAGFSIRQ